jgi:hypothetical protein
MPVGVERGALGQGKGGRIGAVAGAPHEEPRAGRARFCIEAKPLEQVPRRGSAIEDPLATFRVAEQAHGARLSRRGADGGGLALALGVRVELDEPGLGPLLTADERPLNPAIMAP